MAEHIEIDITKEKDEEIAKLLQITNIIIMGAGKTDEINRDTVGGIIYIDISDEIAGGVVMTVFTFLTKEENDASHQKYIAYTATIGGTTVNIQTIVEKIKTSGIKLNFLMATPIVELMTLFKSMFDEVGTGVTRLKVRKLVIINRLKRDHGGRIGRSDTNEKELT